MQESVDQMNRTIRCDEKPQRIVSLVPSQTELLYDLGLGDRVVGITKFCIHPNEWFRNKTRVGGTKNVDFDKIHALQPDLIIGNKEENSKKDILQLEQEYPVWMSDIHNLLEAYQMITQIGSLTNTEEQAQSILKTIQNNFNDLEFSARKQVIYAIWRNPWMFAGTNVFINEMLDYAGFDNILNDENLLKSFQCQQFRYPALEKEHLQQLAPDYVLLSSEPYPFKEKHIEEIKSILPQSKIVLVDGEIFSWYGSRLRKTPDYIQKLRGNL